MIDDLSWGRDPFIYFLCSERLGRPAPINSVLDLPPLSRTSCAAHARRDVSLHAFYRSPLSQGPVSKAPPSARRPPPIGGHSFICKLPRASDLSNEAHPRNSAEGGCFNSEFRAGHKSVDFWGERQCSSPSRTSPSPCLGPGSLSPSGLRHPQPTVSVPSFSPPPASQLLMLPHVVSPRGGKPRPRWSTALVLSSPRFRFAFLCLLFVAFCYWASSYVEGDFSRHGVNVPAPAPPPALPKLPEVPVENEDILVLADADAAPMSAPAPELKDIEVEHVVKEIEVKPEVEPVKTVSPPVSTPVPNVQQIAVKPMEKELPKVGPPLRESRTKGEGSILGTLPAAVTPPPSSASR
ncbi:hypothetical protein BDK51DRAFT_39870 [Blyttiomyces helicus]|uniref:Uncharacterized protein n=1 Tax=Blyttiomyces helicus TaxID=388810 RepID=A0A4P9W004_9FUNG|nr:hypothetical protein BDK51DRAFT_39870 [Blyttiomyces helicus]|eukprot:RKO83998.1 hypothetical protein BDK51DRAFT_39870 [Blyttiomyces helicus]